MSDPTIVRYAELHRSLRRLKVLEKLAASCYANDPTGEKEAEHLLEFVGEALTLAVIAADLEYRGGHQEAGADTDLLARVVVAARAAHEADRAIYTPMDGPLAKVHVSAELLDAALEAL